MHSSHLAISVGPLRLVFNQLTSTLGHLSTCSNVRVLYSLARNERRDISAQILAHFGELDRLGSDITIDATTALHLVMMNT